MQPSAPISYPFFRCVALFLFLCVYVRIFMYICIFYVGIYLYMCIYNSAVVVCNALTTFAPAALLLYYTSLTD